MVVTGKGESTEDNGGVDSMEDDEIGISVEEEIGVVPTAEAFNGANPTRVFPMSNEVYQFDSATSPRIQNAGTGISKLSGTVGVAYIHQWRPI